MVLDEGIIILLLFNYIFAATFIFGIDDLREAGWFNLIWLIPFLWILFFISVGITISICDFIDKRRNK